MLRKRLQGCAVALITAFIAGGARAEPLEPPKTAFEQLLDLSLPLVPPGQDNKPQPADKFIPAPRTTNGWEAKAGVDPAPSASPLLAARAEQIGPGAVVDRSAGVAWANVTAPGLGLPLGWDKASIDTRFDPQHEEGKFGTTFSRSLPVGSAFSLTWQNSYSVTRTQSNGTPAATTAATPGVPGAGGASQVLGSNQAVRFNFYPTDTSVSVGAAISSTDDKWLRSMSAEQKLFGTPLSITGSINQTATGDFNKSVKAGFKQSW